MTPKEWRRAMTRLVEQLSKYLFADVSYETTDEGTVNFVWKEKDKAFKSLGWDPDDIVSFDADTMAHHILMGINRDCYMEQMNDVSTRCE